MEKDYLTPVIWKWDKRGERDIKKSFYHLNDKKDRDGQWGSTISLCLNTSPNLCILLSPVQEHILIACLSLCEICKRLEKCTKWRLVCINKYMSPQKEEKNPRMRRYSTYYFHRTNKLAVFQVLNNLCTSVFLRITIWLLVFFFPTTLMSAVGSSLGC